MKYTLGTAAKAVGKSKSTISKAIKSGKISAHKTDDGIFEIDPSELHRVYPLTPSATVAAEQLDTPQATGENSSEIVVLEAKLEIANNKIEMANKRIEELAEDRDEWRKQATRLLEKSSPATGVWSRLFKK